MPIFQVAISSGAEQTLPVFTDVTGQAGINFKHSYGDFDLSNIVEGTGAGVMFFDYNGDGWLDIYFVNGCWLKNVNDNRGRTLRGKLTNSLYRNNRDGTFSDVTKEAGVGHEGFGFGSFLFANIAVQVGGYYVIAMLLIPLGYGHVRVRRWARTRKRRSPKARYTCLSSSTRASCISPHTRRSTRTVCPAMMREKSRFTRAVVSYPTT